VEECLAEALRLGAGNAELCAAVARAITSHGRDPGAAIAAARQACKVEAGSAEAHDALAMALYSAGEYDTAVAAAEQAARLEPQAAEFVYDLGVIQEARGDLAGARESFGRAVGLAPDFEEAQEALRRVEGAF
jgi:Flp pilus assembly protein TadD